METESKLVPTGGWDEGVKILFWDNGNILEQIEVDVAQQFQCTKCHRIAYFKMVKILFHEFHLNNKKNSWAYLWVYF